MVEVGGGEVAWLLRPCHLQALVGKNGDKTEHWLYLCNTSPGDWTAANVVLFHIPPQGWPIVLSTSPHPQPCIFFAWQLMAVNQGCFSTNKSLKAWRVITHETVRSCRCGGNTFPLLFCLVSLLLHVLLSLGGKVSRHPLTNVWNVSTGSFLKVSLQECVR